MVKKIIFLLAFFSFFVVINTTAIAQSAQKIDITLKKQTIKELISTIEKKTDYTFLYSDIDVDAPVDIDVEGKSIREVLNMVFGPYDISYEIKNKRIILRKGANRTTAQTLNKITVKGTVLDAQNEPLSGAAITIKSQQTGTVSDIYIRNSFLFLK